MTDKSMIEVVARAIMCGFPGNATDLWDDIGPDYQAEWRALARAAIEAMRLLPDAVLQKADIPDDRSPAPFVVDWAYYRELHAHVIDAALAGERE